MSISPRTLPALAAGTLLFLTPFPPPAARAATEDGAFVRLVLKDGVVLQGRVRREGHGEFEDGELIFYPNGFFFIDDTPRRQYFSSALMQQPAQETPPPQDTKIHPIKRDIAILHPQKVPSLDEVLDIGSCDEKWNRVVKFRSGLKPLTVHERLVELTPYYAFFQATEHWVWPSVYLTRELGPDAVRNLLSQHPDYAEDPKLTPAARADRRFAYVDFMAQAGFYDEAENELSRLASDGPAQAVKDKIESVRGVIHQWQARDRLEDLKKMHNAGQFGAVRKKLAEFKDKEADPQTAIELNDLRQKYKAADQATADATRLLDDLPKSIRGDARLGALAEAADALRAELQPEILPRLEAFLGQAHQAERQCADGQAPAKGPAQLLALAVTGWLGVLPDETPERAIRLWRARQFVQTYLTAAPGDRKAKLDSYQSDRENVASLDDFTRLIPLLPPPDPEPLDNIGADPVVRTTGKGQNAVKYVLQLPPEYRHSRNYPVLIVLSQLGEDPKDQLARWREAAALNGYILVAPEWSKGINGGYGYSEQEHAAVLETLADLRRHFAVDSDRVFLFGWGQGGAMAFDVGLSHADLFAGVLPMSAGPALFSERYFRNGQYLPFYIVDGDHSGDMSKDNDMNKHIRHQFEEWVNAYPMMWIQYKGRGVEFYGAEMPMMFDWMRNKKREFPMEGVGGYSDPEKSKNFTTHRTTDNSFYWLTTNNIQQRCINTAANWKQALNPATLWARIDLEENTVLLDTSGVSQVTVWLGANGQGVDMVNFDKPVTVRWNGNVVRKAEPVTRSLETLLEDLGRRGDRQRVFTAKLEFESK